MITFMFCLAVVVALISISVPSGKVYAFNDNTNREFLREAQQLHNEYRANHAETGSLFLNDRLVESSKQRCAEYLRPYTLHPPPPAEIGENIWINFAPIGKELEVTAYNAIKSWYDEEKNYDQNYPGWRDSSSHFTMLVWRSTQQFGCAHCASVDRVKDGVTNVIVCHYSPAGNQIGHFVANVMPKTYTDDNVNSGQSKPSKHLSKSFTQEMQSELNPDLQDFSGLTSNNLIPTYLKYHGQIPVQQSWQIKQGKFKPMGSRVMLR